MAKQFRASEEVNALIATAQGDIDALKAKWESAEPAPEEVAKFNELLSQLEALAQEAQLASAEERLQKFRASQEAPKLPAPKLTVAATPKNHNMCAGEAFKLMIQSKFGESLSAEQHYRMSSNGFNINNARIPFKFENLNARKRKQYRTLATNANPGQDLIWSQYSDNVVEIMAYQSPLLNVLNYENDANGNLKSYFTLDDSANASTDITASGGSQLVPTIPDADVSDSVKKCGVFAITSGYQKITREAMTDSYVSLQAKFEQWSAIRHAAKMEADFLGASGNGETGREGLLAAATAADPITGGVWTYAGLQTFYYGIPIQYRKNLVFVSNSTTYGALHADLLDGNERSYFDVNIQDDYEYETFMGRKFFVSESVTDDMILAFDPSYFVVRTVNEGGFDLLTEKFYPHLAACSLMRFGCMWNGPATAVQTIELDS